MLDERDRFDKFTESARRVLAMAQEEAQRFMHYGIGSEHILLALIREGEGVAARVLRRLGVNLVSTREMVEELVGRGEPRESLQISLSPAGKRVIEQAVREARALNHTYVGSEHLLLGLVSLPDSGAAYLLEQMEIKAINVRSMTFQILGLAARPASEARSPETGGSPQPMQQKRDRFDKFDEQARRALSLAQEEAQRFQHNYIGTEHLLLGLVRMEKSTAGRVLNRLGVQLQQVRNAIEFIIGRGDRIVLGEIGLTPRSKKVIELAVDEARRLDHHYIGTEHILLGLVREGQGIAAGVLESTGVKLARVRSATLEVLGQADALQEDNTAQEEEQPGLFPGASVTLASGPMTETYQNDPLLHFAGAYVRGEMQIEQGALIIQDADDLVPAPASAEERANRFTVRARRVLVRAREEARLQQKVLVGSEHLLLALIREQNGIAFHVLRNLGIDNQQLQALAQSFVTPENFSQPAETTGLTIDGQRAIELAVEEARLPRQTAVGSEHLLLGLLKSEGSASGLLISSGLTLEKARAEVRRLQGF